MRLGTNTFALNAARALSNASNEVASASSRLSSGLRINSAQDDAAGIAIADQLRANRNVSLRAYRNANDYISAYAITEAALTTMSDIVTKMQELATQAANGSYSLTQRQAMQKEIDALTSEHNRIVSTTTFNGINLLTKNTSTAQLGYGSDATIQFNNASEITNNEGTFSFGTATSGIGSMGLLSGDLNNDGYADFLSSNGFVYYGNSSGVLGSAVSLFGGVDRVAIGDLNGDGIDDVVTVSMAGTVSWRINNGNGTFTTTSTTMAGYTSSVQIGDTNGDGKNDIILLGSQSAITLLQNSGSFTASASYFNGALTGYVDRSAVLDYNGDGFADIISLRSSGTSELLFGNANGTFTLGISGLANSGVGSINTLSVGDFNRDGYDDFVINTGSINSVAVRFGNAQGIISQSVTLDTSGGVGQGSASVADLNNDGNLDIVISSHGSFARVYSGDGNGTFTAQANIVPGGLSYFKSVATGDFNGDGVQDVIGTDSVNGLRRLQIQTTRTTSQIGQQSILSIASAKEAIVALANRAQEIQLEIGKVGAFQSRLTIAANHLSSTSSMLSDAESRIRDADISTEVGRLVSAQIKQQASTAILAQANQQPTLLLQLLRSEN